MYVKGGSEYIYDRFGQICTRQVLLDTYNNGDKYIYMEDVDRYGQVWADVDRCLLSWSGTARHVRKAGVGRDRGRRDGVEGREPLLARDRCGGTCLASLMYNNKSNSKGK